MQRISVVLVVVVLLVSAPVATQPESAPESLPESLPETGPETLGDVEAEGKVPAATGEKKGIAFATGAGCDPRPEGVVPAGYTLYLEFLQGDGEACGVKLTIRNVRKKSVFEERIPSSWVYLDLPPGGYEIVARSGRGERTYSTQTTEGRLQKGRLFFDAR